jgi:hypothetical protein
MRFAVIDPHDKVIVTHCVLLPCDGRHQVYRSAWV